jgi:lipoate-protein ligase A
MLILDSPSTDPYFNIAAEEYLLKETDGDFTFIYVNDPSIIIGKHQNAYAEINLPYILEKGIPVVRRISGGGTVWHDPGNVNFSFILNGKEGQLVNFREYAMPVLTYLQNLKIPAEFGTRNEILVDGRKISGNAEHVYRKRVLHHGTLLFSSDLHELKAALGTEPGKYEDRAVQSVRSEVRNILDLLEPEADVAAFRKGLIAHLSGFFEGSERYAFSEKDTARVRELASQKYSTWKWNIGYSPRYRMTRSMDWNGKPVNILLEVEKGKITEIEITSDDADHELFDRLSAVLAGADHEPGEIRERISGPGLASPMLIDYFVKAIF